MKTTLFYKIQSVFRKYSALLLDFRSNHHRNFITFLFFFLLSAIFWFFRVLSLDYEDKILYPVRYINLPEDYVILNKLPEKLTLEVKAKGRRILLSKLNLNLIPIKFDVNSFISRDTNPDSLYILTNSFKDILSEELEGVEILNIEPDTLFFRFTNMEVKKVAVKPKFNDLQAMFAPQFMINGNIVVEPDSIIISGPGSLLKNITSVFTEPLTCSDLKDTVTQTSVLEKQQSISYSQKRIYVTIPVDKYTQAEYYLPVVALNLPDSLQLKTFPERIRISYNITLSNYEKINPERIRPHVDYNDVLNNSDKKLRLFLVDTPDIINAIKFSPERVEYLLTRQ
ncbi:MAG: YbbR-like domain-containing protein [Bacteroidales bacterium]|nr:YbbR-like domain-containing protein [Bacteroidales bacterium]